MKIANNIPLKDIQVNETTVTGIAGVFNTPGALEYGPDGQPFRRYIRSGAVKTGKTIRCFQDHKLGDMDYFFCSSEDNTLSITINDADMPFTANIIDTAKGMDLLKQIKRKKEDGSSVVGVSFGGDIRPDSTFMDYTIGDVPYLVFTDITLDEFSFCLDPVFSQCRVQNSKESDIGRLVAQEQERIARNKKLLDEAIVALSKLK